MYGNNHYGAPYYTGAPYYSNGGYSSPMYQPQNSMQPSVPNMNTNKLYTTGIEDVRARQLPPNSDFIFLDNDKPIIYRKTTDATGKMDIQVFEIKPFQAEQTKPEQPIDLSQFALKTDIESLKTDIEQVKESLRLEAKKKSSSKEANV